jgi:predicted dehydrogenase
MGPRRVCLLGYGKVAREFHRPVWEQLSAEKLAEVTVVCEPSKAGTGLAQSHFPAASAIQAEAARVLDEVECDVVDICTPGPTHASLVLAAIERGFDVLVEKPLCHTGAQVDSIISSAAKRSASVAVCQTFRFLPPSQALIRARDAGNLGEIARVQMSHHARHALSEAEWVTTSRPDGVLFANAVHFVDLAHVILGTEEDLCIDALKVYETSHRRVLTGFELLASDSRNRDIYIDFVQDTLMHSSLHTRVLVSGTGADAELRFYPSGFRLSSGVLDPVDELVGQGRRLVELSKGLVSSQRRIIPHMILARDLLAAAREGRPTIVPPSSVRPTIALLERIADAWRSATPAHAASGRGTVAIVPKPSHGQVMHLQPPSPRPGKSESFWA